MSVYTYRLNTSETWCGDRLAALESTTEDDGDLFKVNTVSDGEAISVETAANSWTAPSPSTISGARR